MGRSRLASGVRFLQCPPTTVDDNGLSTFNRLVAGSNPAASTSGSVAQLAERYNTHVAFIVVIMGMFRVA